MQLPATNGPMRAWLRAKVIPNVVFSPPLQDAPTLPMLVVYRVGGLPDDQGSDWPDFIVECWDVNLKLAEDLAVQVSTAVLNAVNERPVVLDQTVIEATSVNGYQPSSGITGAKRYRVDVSMRMRRS
jgi:hypothetical protein